MSVDFGIGSLATFVRHLHETRPLLPDGWNFWYKPNYFDYIKSPEWKAKAKQAKERAGYRCEKCGETKGIEAHHKTYVRLGFERPNDIVVLCRKHHQDEHTS